MTRTSELFCSRRSRFGHRNDLAALVPDSSLDNRTFHHHNSNNRRRRDRLLDLDASDPPPPPPRRPPQIRHSNLRSSHQELDAVQLSEASSQSSSGNIIDSENFVGLRNRLRFSGNERLPGVVLPARERLPGAVLLARERLLERLRSVSLTQNRQNNSAPSGINRSDLTLRDGISLIDARDWETEISRELLGTLFTDSMSPTEQLLGPPEISKRPPGLTQEALDCLQLEVFSNIECSDEAEISMPSRECGICLESFLEGDELKCLPCGHRFHSSCLEPWVRTCGDCPYCRRGIVVESPMQSKQKTY